MQMGARGAHPRPPLRGKKKKSGPKICKEREKKKLMERERKKLMKREGRARMGAREPCGAHPYHPETFSLETMPVQFLPIEII